MSGTNPGAWPDQPPKWAEDLEEMPERLYTAAEMKAAKFETVERVVSALCELPSRIIPDARGTVGEFDVTRFAPMVDRNMVLVAIEKLKEEIENE